MSTNKVVIARKPVTNSVILDNQAPTIVPTTTVVMPITIRIVLTSGAGVLPEITRESVNNSEKNAEQSSTKLKSIMFLGAMLVRGL